MDSVARWCYVEIAEVIIKQSNMMVPYESIVFYFSYTKYLNCSEALVL